METDDNSTYLCKILIIVIILHIIIYYYMYYSKSAIYTKNNPKKFLEKMSNILYPMFLSVYGNNAATPYNAHKNANILNNMIPRDEYLAYFS